MGQPLLVLPHLERPKEIGKHHRLLCLTGPSKGKAFYIHGKRYVLGRGDDCDIRILDTQLSRQHAEIVLLGDSYTLTDLKSQNGVVINDKKISQAVLAPGDTIIIGQSVFKYSVVEVAEKDNAPLKSVGTGSIFDDSKNDLAKDKKNKKPLLILIGVLVVGAILFLDGGSEKKVQQNSKKKFENTASEFNDVLKKKSLQEDRDLKIKLESIFQRGLRELREGNYFRAMSEFNHALSLSPNNGRASYYLSKSKQALDTEVEQHFIQGKKNFESIKYSEAIQSYCAIARLLQNTQEDSRYLDAMENIKEIEIKLGMEEGEIKCI